MSWISGFLKDLPEAKENSTNLSQTLPYTLFVLALLELISVEITLEAQPRDSSLSLSRTRPLVSSEPDRGVGVNPEREGPV